MLLIVGTIVLLIAVALILIPRLRAAGAVHPAALGWMSERWLAEHRASHSR